MPKEKLQLRPYKHPASGIYQIRGTYLGVKLDESSGSRSERDCWAIIEKRKREIYEEVVLQKPRERDFSEAALGYVNSGGEAKFLEKILFAEITIERKRRVFGELQLNEIDQTVIDILAKTLYPNATDATRNRQVYTPVSAVLQFAADQPSWKYLKGRIRRPPTPLGRIDWRTPKEMQWWLDRCGAERAIITGYLGTGARASELVNLDWPDVSPALHSLTLWEDETKSGNARSIELQTRVRGTLPPRSANGKGPVYLNSNGERWTKGAIQKALDRVTIREVRLKATDLEREQIEELLWRGATKKVDEEARSQARKDVQALYEAIAEREDVPWIHPHVLRHTWATWGYAVTRDLAWLMARGGWAKPAMAMRYTHVGTPDLAEDVLSYGWEMRADLAPRLPALPRPAESA